NSKGTVNVYSGTYSTNNAPAFNMQSGTYTELNIYGGTFRTGTATAVSLSGGTLGNLSSDAVFETTAEYPILFSGNVTVTGTADFSSYPVQATGSLTVASGGSITSDSLIESTSAASISINSGGAFNVKELTTDQDSVSLSVAEGTVLNIDTVTSTTAGDITQNTAQKLVEDGAAGTIGDTTVYCVAYLNYSGTVMNQATWMSSQASPTILSADAVQALKTGTLLIPSGKEFIGWSEQYSSVGTGTVSTDLAPGKNPVNGNYQIYPVYKTAVDSNAATKIGNESYETIADAMNFANSGSVITLINDVNSALTIDATSKDLSLDVTNGVSYNGRLTTTNSSGSSVATFSKVIAGTEGLQVSVGSVSVAGRIVSGTVTTVSGTTEVASGAVLTLSKNAKVKIDSGNFVNNGTIYVYGEISKDGAGTLTNNGKIYLMTSKAIVGTIDSGSKAIKEYSNSTAQNTTGSTVDPIITVLNAQQPTTTYQSQSTSDDTIIIIAAGVTAIAAACLAFMVFRRT
ncbi:MAG: hypothetical protein IJ248_08975, partial [Candidatus Methanomethylophilaceae archaeon]|nr:hypothetical protein [Candidatus Methanomethylophilaceae archaeon]